MKIREQIVRLRETTCDTVDEAETMERLYAVYNTACLLSRSIEQGFASEIRPDIARATLNRAIAAVQEIDE